MRKAKQCNTKEQHLLATYMYKLMEKNNKKAKKYIHKALSDITCDDKTMSKETIKIIKQKVREAY